jgi:uncharacterized protein YciI
MRTFVAIFLCFFLACTRAGTPNVNVTVPVSSAINTPLTAEQEAKDTENRVEEPQPDLDKLEDYKAEPIVKGAAAPKDGVLMSPRQVAEAALDAAQAEKLETANRVLSNTRNTELKLLNDNQKRLEGELAQCREKSWWDKHGTATMLGVGVLTGIGLSIATFKAAVQIKNSN